MKKILIFMMIAVLALSMAACSNKPAEIPGETVETGATTETPAPETTPEAPEETKQPEETKKPEETKQPEKTPDAPAVSETPVTTPAPTPEAPKTVGNTLLAAFKANSGGSALSIAENLASNPAIKVPVGAMSVEEGYLTGFDNAEIKGFKEGAVFMPMIGTIPFVGYVFTLENAADAPAFIANLKANANLRWNICTSADEMVTGSAGNKVFFVMCPTSFEE